jgi:uncharacterized protein (DUF1778 family)
MSRRTPDRLLTQYPNMYGFKAYSAIISPSSDRINSMDKVVKNARLEARVTLEQKQLMERAAGLRGQNLTEFMISVLAEAATQTIKDRETIDLTERDRQVFAQALLNPNATSDRAIADAQWYAQMTRNRKSD